MVQLLQMKETINRFIGRFEIYIVALLKFLIAFAAFTLINSKIGYMTLLHDYPVDLVLALLCTFLPAAIMLLFGAALILANFYALSLEIFAIAGLIFLILFCLYFRFSTGKGIYAILTPLLSSIGIPYVMPVAVGLVDKVYSVIAVICGEVVYFLIKIVIENEALFRSTEENSTRTIITLASNAIVKNKEMYLFIIAFGLAGIVVSCIRKLSVDHAHTIAIVVGIVVEIAILVCGNIYLGNTDNTTSIIIGCIISLVIALVIDFLSHGLDYSRVEKTQFEDDNYYYYVKAVPKASVPAQEVELKEINKKKAKKEKGKKVKAAKVTTPEKTEESLEERIMRELHEEDEKN